MISTTVIWPQNGTDRNPTTEEGLALSFYANSISGDFECVLTTAEDDNNNVISTRTWPDVATAQTWVDHILANFSVTSAVVNPEV